MKLKFVSVLAAFALVATVQAYAGEGCCKSKAVAAAGEGQAKAGCCKAGESAAKGCCSAKLASADGKGACASKAGASCAVACGSMPKMMYKVGDKTVCCPKEAADLVKGDAKIEYVVADKTYTDKGEALVAYADVLDKHLAKITTVTYGVGDETMQCPMAAKDLASKMDKPVAYRVGTASFEDQAKADKAAKDAREAADKVKMVMTVDGKPVEGCPVDAKATACKESKKVEYAIGEVKTECDKTARVELAKAKITAAVQQIASAATPSTAQKG